MKKRPGWPIFNTTSDHVGPFLKQVYLYCSNWTFTILLSWEEKDKKDTGGKFFKISEQMEEQQNHKDK